MTQIAAMDKGCSERNERVSNHLKSWLGHMCALVNEFSYEPKSTLRKLLMFFFSFIITHFIVIWQMARLKLKTADGHSDIKKPVKIPNLKHWKFTLVRTTVTS